MDTNPTLVTAQQVAIQEVRARYERGHITYETFRNALDAIVAATDAAECREILDGVPASPLAPLAALENSAAATELTQAHMMPRYKRIVAFMGQTKKLRRSWQLAEYTQTYAVMGEAKLDLRLAEMPARARLRVTAIAGNAELFVPHNVHVTVHTTALLSDTHALGEGVSGVVAFGHEEHTPAGQSPRAELEIDVFALMANVKVILSDERQVSVSEMAREALRAATEAFQRGLLQPPDARPSLESGSMRSQLPGSAE